jgi:hypothetical protein
VSALQKIDYYEMVFFISFDAELVLSTGDWMGVKLYKAAMWQNFMDNYIYKKLKQEVQYGNPSIGAR